MSRVGCGGPGWGWSVVGGRLSDVWRKRTGEARGEEGEEGEEGEAGGEEGGREGGREEPGWGWKRCARVARVNAAGLPERRRERCDAALEGAKL